MPAGQPRIAARCLVIGLLLVAARPWLDGDPARYVHIRWSPDVTAGQRARLESEFSLRMQQGDGRSFGYDLLDDSTGNIRALLEHPAVEDTQDLDRERFAVGPDAEAGDSRTGLAWRWGIEAIVPFLLPVAAVLIFFPGCVLLHALLAGRVFHATGAPPPRADRLLELDALRGIAALSVVLFHYTTKFGEGSPHPTSPLFTLPLGHYGVELFFVISGMVILMTLERSRSVFDFLVARVGRLYPAYWVAMTLTFLALTQVALPNTEPATASLYRWNLTMMQRFVGVADVDGVYWSLQVELAFYLLMIVLAALRMVPVIEAVVIGWLALLSMDAAAGVLGMLVPEPRLLRELVTLFGYAELFIVGLAMHVWRTRGRSVGLMVAVAWAVGLRASHVPAEATYVTLAITATFLLVVHRRAGWLAVRPLLFIGAISYPLYLVHQNLGFMLLRRLYAGGWGANLAIGAVLLAAGALAALLHWGVELPGQRLARRLRRSPAPPRPAAGGGAGGVTLSRVTRISILLVGFVATLAVAAPVAAQGAPDGVDPRVEEVSRILKTARAGTGTTQAEQHARALQALSFDALPVAQSLLPNDWVGTEAARAMLTMDESRGLSLIFETVPRTSLSVQLVAFVWFLEHESSLGDRLDAPAHAAAMRVLERLASSAMAELALYTIGMSGTSDDFPLLERYAQAPTSTQGMRAASEAALGRLGSQRYIEAIRTALRAPVPERLTYMQGVRVAVLLRQAGFSANRSLAPLVCGHMTDPTVADIDIFLELPRVAANTLSLLLEPVSADLPRGAPRRSIDQWKAYCAAL